MITDDLYTAMMFGDYAVNNCKAEPCSTALCREIRLKQFLKIARRDALAIVRYLRHYNIANGVIAGGHQYPWVVDGCVKRLDSVLDQVNKHAFHLLGVDRKF